MAITHNAAARDGIDGLTSLTIAVAVGAGENIASLIGLSYTPIIAASTNSVTFDGVTATFIQLSADFDGFTEQYYVKGTSPGSRTLIVAWDDVVSAIVGIEVMNGVDQTLPIGSAGTATSGASAVTSLSVALTGTTADNWIVDTVRTHASTSVTPNASQTQRWGLIFGSPPTRTSGGGSTKVSAGGSVTMQWSLSPAEHGGIAAVEFRAAAEPDTGKPVNCYTSYGYVDDPRPTESFKDPAVQQRIWVNDRRHMQGDL